VAAAVMLTFFTLNWLVLPLLVWRARRQRTGQDTAT